MRYCKHRDILMSEEKWSKCAMCYELFRNGCKTELLCRSTSMKKVLELHENLVNEYLRKKKLERILDESIL